jgi:hypothetical protein
MPAKLPAAEPHGSGDWTPMLQKDTSVMTYRAWRHCLPVRAGARGYGGVRQNSG